MAASLLENMMAKTEDQVRAQLAKVSTPSLDRLRAEIKTMPMSSLLMAFVTGGGQLVGDEELKMDKQELEIVLAAYVVVLGDEVDRRFPVPPK